MVPARGWLPARLATAVVSSLFSVFAAEAALEMHPRLGGRALENSVRTKYVDGPNGIFFSDPAFPVTRLMKPRFRTRMFYNGYTWSHETDAFGFRNATDRPQADVALLGDSFIYGHGVDLPDTVGARLERITGWPIVNMARQGDYALPQLCLLNAYMETFTPRVVVLAFYQNDPYDVSFFLSDAAIRDYLARPMDDVPCPAPPRGPAERQTTRAPAEGASTGLETGAPPPTLDNVLSLAYLRRAVWGGRSARHHVAEQRSTDAGSIAWQATRKAILQMTMVADRHGARFVLAPILPITARPYGQVRDLLGSFATDEGIEVIDTTAVTDRRPEWFLEHDGHFSPEGAEAFARMIAAQLAADAQR